MGSSSYGSTQKGPVISGRYGDIVRKSLQQKKVTVISLHRKTKNQLDLFMSPCRTSLGVPILL